MHYWIDGYNLLFRLAKNYRAMRQQERKILSALNRSITELNYSVTIVFDGREKDPPEAVRRNLDSLVLIYTPHHQTADEYMLKIISESSYPERETIITSDLELLRKAKQRGARGQTVEEFITQLIRKKKKKTSAPTDQAFHETPSELQRLLKLFEERLRNDLSF